jgi:HPt (histidine-containing phosphotransfer) domain-containing protein
VDQGEKEADNKLQQQLITDFVRDNQNKYNELINAIDTGDLTQAHRIAHTLKSEAGLIGRTQLHKSAATVEGALKNGANLTTEEQLHTLRRELHAAIDEMAAYSDKAVVVQQVRHHKETVGGFDAPRLFALINKLEPMLWSGNPESLDLIDEISLIPGSEELIRQMEDFYFSTAADLLKGIKERLEKDHQWNNK